jgi:hypothetical protein
VEEEEEIGSASSQVHLFRGEFFLYGAPKEKAMKNLQEAEFLF